MEIPGMNPLPGRMQVPGQSQPVGPGGSQSKVPDLILDAPGQRIPTEQAPQQAPASTTGPYQAPLQAIVQQVQQQMTAALMEMGLPATQQNQQMAQLLADYGHAVNSQTLGILKQAVSGLPDRSPQTLEAAVILLSKELPVTEQNITAIKQFLNGGPLPQQLQNLPQNVVNLLQQMQQSAQATSPAANPAPAANQQAQLTGANPAPPALNPAGSTSPPPPPGTASTATSTATSPAPGTSIPAQPGATQSPIITSPGNPATQLQIQITQTQIQIGQTPGLTPQATNLQATGANLPQLAAGSALIQQVAGQLQAIENRSDGIARLGERTTAEKVAVPDSTLQAIKGIDSIAGQSTQSTQSAQSRQVSQQMPSAYSKDQESLQQLHLFMHGGEVPAVEQVNPGGKTASLQSPEAILLQLLRVTLETSRVAGHLAENMQLKDFGQLYIQHQQIIQLTGLLENKLHEFHQLFTKAFPELSQDVQKLLQHESLDTFGKLAKLLDDHQAQIQERLKLPGTADETSQVLTSLRQLMEQVGVSVEKVQSHMLAREMLTQNMPVHVVPMMVHFKGESFPAEVYIHQDAENEHRPDAHGNLPLKITLTLETKNMGRVGVDLITLKDDMTVDLKVRNRRIKLVIDDAIQQLKHKIEYLGDYKISHLACRIDPDLDNRQSMLLPVKRNIRSLRRIEGVV